jgi:hypothetical protein
MARHPFYWVARLLKPRDANWVEQEQPLSLMRLKTLDTNNLHPSHSNILKELLRQARWSFNFAILMMTASSIISIAGIILLLSGNVKEGTVTAAGGLASYIVPANCLRLAEKANDRLNRSLTMFGQEK